MDERDITKLIDRLTRRLRLVRALGRLVRSALAVAALLGVALVVDAEGEGRVRIVVSEGLLAYRTAELVLHLEDHAGNFLEQSMLLPVVCLLKTLKSEFAEKP